jgi:hypothetical protein
VPFHTWTPTCTRAATPSRLHGVGDGGVRAPPRVPGRVPFTPHDWRPAVWVLAVLTRGPTPRCRCGSACRLFVDAHAGYVLMGLQAATVRGREASLFYLFVYTFMVVVRGGRGDRSRATTTIDRRLRGGVPTARARGLLSSSLAGGNPAHRRVHSEAGGVLRRRRGPTECLSRSAVAHRGRIVAYLRVVLASRSETAEEGAAPRPGTVGLRRPLDGTVLRSPPR